MLRVKKSKILDLRRFGKNTYTEDVSAAESSGYDEGYNDGYADGQEEGGETQSPGLADALTLAFNWNSLVGGSGPNISRKPDGFLFCQKYVLNEDFPWSSLVTVEDEVYGTCYTTNSRDVDSNLGDRAFYTYEELNNYTAETVPLSGSTGLYDLSYGASGVSSACWMITPLYKEDNVGSNPLGALYVPYIRIGYMGHVSSDVSDTFPATFQEIHFKDTESGDVYRAIEFLGVQHP